MSELKEVQLNFIKLAIVLPIVDQDGAVVDISGASVKTITLKKPDKLRTEAIYTADFYTDGTDGLLQYLTVDGDLDTLGVWEAQADITHANFEGGASVERFKVVRNITC